MMKYVHFARIAFFDHIRNRVRLSTRFVVFMVLAWVMIAMWKMIYLSGYGAAGVTLTDMSWYNGIVQMMFFLSPRLFVVIDEDVRSGNIGYFLGRPMPYLWMRFAEGMGALGVHILIFYGLGIPFLYFYIGEWPSLGAFVLCPALFALAVGSILHLLMQICCGLSTFWTDDAIFIYHAYQKFILLLGGVYIPVSMYPEAFFPDVLQLLPFAALAGLPSQLVLNPSASAIAFVILLQCVWGGLIVWGLQKLYAVCLRKVELHGG